MSLNVTDITPCIGAEIKTDHDTLLSGSAAAEIRDVLERRGVIVFRELGFTDQQQVAFTKTLGTLIDEGENGVFKVTLDTRENAHADYLRGAFYWHIDGSTLEVPILASLLSARRLSESGGDTEFCNTYAAYDELPEAEKSELENLKVVHSLEAAQLYVHPEPSYEELMSWKMLPSRAIPLVWTHRSGRKSLVLGATASHVVGMDLEESRALLCRLRDWATQSRFVYRHEWTLGDLVMWDNTGTMHRATPYPLDSDRMMHRTKLEGEEPVV